MNTTARESWATPPSVSRQFHDLLASDWERTLREFPLLATELGDRRYHRNWPDLSLENLHRRHRENQAVLGRLAALESAQLSVADQLSFRLFRKSYETLVEEFGFRWHLLPLTAREGIQDASSVADAIVFEETADYDDWIERLRSFPIYMDQTLALMREGIRSGMVHAKVVMQRVPAQIQRQIVATPEESPFYKPFAKISERVPERERCRLRNEAREVISASIVPAYQQMLEFFEHEYLPACSTRVGIWQLPRGEELYAFFARKFTTTSHTPQEIHEIGHSEVRRIRIEMEQIVRQVGFSGSWRDFLDHLRTAPQFYAHSAGELTDAYRQFCERVDRQLPRLFHRLPKVGYDIQSIPANLAPDTTTAYYRPPSADGKRAGTYFINLYRPEVRPKYEIPALSLHEAVPGHHLQIARAMELDHLPAFRRYAPEGAFTGYVEGWALYAEALGEELGCYSDPYDKFGQLTYEIWRAVRLVVDTGLHMFHWPREQAIEYFLEHTAKARLDIENEVDRYIAWPGQALAYKIGELEMSRLRRMASESLGKGFDLRDFHEVVLENGPLPLDVLEHHVKEWVDRQRATRVSRFTEH